MHHSGPVVTKWMIVGCLFMAVAPVAQSQGQLGNPVYVNDSPRAWELFQQAQDQAADNVGEAVRIYQELLSEYSHKVLPRYDSGDQAQWITVRLRVLEQLRGNEELLARYRLIENAAAERMLQDGDLMSLAVTRSLTPAGLEAMLRLAQTAMEAGSFPIAIRWLDEAADHPDLRGVVAAHYWFMYGTTGRYLNDVDRVDRAVDMLRAIAEPEAIELGEALQAMREQALAPREPDGITSFDAGYAENVDELVGEPIWSATMQNSLIRRTYGDPALLDDKRRATRDNEFREARYLTAVPTVVGSTVYINEGHVISAWDRFTNQRLWRVVRAAVGSDSDREAVGDCNTVAVANDRLVTYTGHAYNTSRSTRGRRVVCLRRSDGAELWEVRLDRLGEGDEFEGLYPCGSPVMVDGMLFVQARRVSKQYLTSCYVLALDPNDDGRLVWMQHIASSGGLKTGTARPYSMMVYDEGSLYVASSVGAIARLDASTGHVDWLRRYISPIQMYHKGRKPWEIHKPAVTEHVVVAVQPDHKAVVVIDKDTGDQLRYFPTGPRTAWGDPRYFLSDEMNIYAVGRNDVRAFPIAALDTPLWHARTLGTIDEPHTIRGRVQLLNDALLVPADGALVLVDRGTGVQPPALPLDVTGNPVAVGNQLIITGSETIAAYMPFEEAENMLRQRLATTPSDADSALSLVRLGMRRDNLALALEAAQLAFTAVSIAPDSTRAGKQQSELFNLLLELDERKLVKTVIDGEKVHDLIGLVAAEPAQYIQHLVAKGDWLADHDMFRSVEAFQSILTNEELAGTLLTKQGVTRRASAWAVEHISSLIETHGPDIYRPQAEFAAARLAALQDEASAGDLAELAMQYPLAPAAVEASIRAADDYLMRGRDADALTVLTTMARHVEPSADAGRIYGALIDACVQSNRMEQAINLIEHAAHQFEGVELIGRTGPRSAEAWLEELGHRRPTYPVIGAMQEGAVSVRGRLVPHVSGSPGPFSSRHVLMIDGDELTLYTARDMQPAWSTTAFDPDVQVLRIDTDGVLLWLPGDGEQPKQQIECLDLATGDSLWITKWFGDYLDALFALKSTRSTAGFDPREVLPLLSRDRIVCVRRTGQIVSLDAADPDEDVHTRETTLDRVYHAELHDYGLILAGMEQVTVPGSVHTQLVSAILVLDPLTLATMHRIEPTADLAVRWIVTDPLGGLVYGTTEGINMVDLLAGETLWEHRAPRIAGSDRAWIAQNSVVFEDDDRQLRSADLATGEVGSPFQSKRLGQWDPTTLVGMTVREGSLYAHYRQRIVRYAPTGEITGADAISDDRSYRWLLPTRDGFLAISRPSNDREAGRARHYRYLFYRLTPDCGLIDESPELPAPEALDRARLVDDWLVLSSRSASLAIPMPSRRPQ